MEIVVANFHSAFINNIFSDSQFIAKKLNVSYY